MRNPFSDDICADESAIEGSAAEFHGEALAALGQTMPEEGATMGRALVLTAPRAGFGKTHLVTRFAAGLAGRAMVVPLTFDLEKPPRWASVLGEVLEKLHRDHGHRTGLTLLDETARFLFARVNQRLIAERKIPCAHPAEAMAALDRNYLEMFDFTNPSQAVAKWFGEHFENLAPLTSATLAEEGRVEPASAGFWLRVLASYAQAAGEPAESRFEALRWAVQTPSGTNLAGGGGLSIIQEGGSPEQSAKDKLRDFGRLLGVFRPVVFVIDHLDAFYRDGQAGLRIAYFVSELRRLLPRSLTVVCANQDVWQATFQSQLPSALEDRLTGGFTQLGGVTIEEARVLVETRLTEAGIETAVAAGFRARLRLVEFFAGQGGRPVSPRAVLRFAAHQWQWLDAALPGRPVPPAGSLFPVVAAGPDPHAAAPAPSTASVVGDQTLDSIAAALQEMAGDEPGRTAAESDDSPGVATVPPDQPEAFQRLKDRLERLRMTPPVAAGDTPAEQIPSNGHGPAPVNPLTAAYTRCLIRRSNAPVAPALDLERVGKLLRFAGQHFPVVRAAELNVPGTTGTAIQWLSPDAEILVGLEPATRPIFWSALTAHAAARSRLNGGLPVKVVAFTDHPSAPHPATQSVSAGGFTLDLVEPTATDLSALSAAGDVLVDVENARLTADAADLSALLAQELDAFWRRLTRLSPADGS